MSTTTCPRRESHPITTIVAWPGVTGVSWGIKGNAWSSPNVQRGLLGSPMGRGLSGVRGEWPTVTVNGVNVHLPDQTAQLALNLTRPVTAVSSEGKSVRVRAGQA